LTNPRRFEATTAFYRARCDLAYLKGPLNLRRRRVDCLLDEHPSDRPDATMLGPNLVPTSASPVFKRRSASSLPRRCGIDTTKGSDMGTPGSDQRQRLRVMLILIRGKKLPESCAPSTSSEEVARQQAICRMIQPSRRTISLIDLGGSPHRRRLRQSGP
jgi:hypothetical protein